MSGSIRIRDQNDEVTSVTDIEDLERHFLKDDLCENNDDGDQFLNISQKVIPGFFLE